MSIGAGRMNRLSKRPQTPQAISTAQSHRKGVPHFSLSYSRGSFNHHWLTYIIIHRPTLSIFFSLGHALTTPPEVNDPGLPRESQGHLVDAHF